MSIFDKAREIVDRRQNQIAENILQEVKDACPVRSGKTRDSFHIEESTDGAQASGTFKTGKLFGKKIAIVSYERTAYWANYGNMSGSIGGRIYPHGEKLVFYDSRKPPGNPTRKSPYSFPSVRAYEGSHFIEEVVRRHS